MIYLNKLLPLIFSPLILCLLIAIMGGWWRKRGLVIGAIALLWMVSTPVIADRLFRVVEAEAVRIEARSLQPADAVVVLSGMQMHVPGQERSVPEWGEAVDRFDGGLEVFAAGRAPIVIFTAGRLPWQPDVDPEGVNLSRIAISRGVPPSRIRLTREVENTDQEARAVRDLLAAEGVVGAPRVILVTSAFHMPRARALFEEAGLRVVAFPVDFRVSAEARGPTDYFPDPGALRRTDIAIRELIGRAYYRARALLR